MEISIIDIGSNSIRYMTAESLNGNLIFSKKTVSTTRLAEGQGPDFNLKEAPIERSLQALFEMSSLSHHQKLPCYAYATSAVREAKNKDDFLKLIKAKTDLNIEVLTGEEEAVYAYMAACPNGGAMIDIGGGSFQLTGKDKHVSYPLGCVRLHDMTGQQSLEKLSRFPFPYLSDISGFENISRWTSVGGTATKLASIAQGLTEYDPDIVSSHVFTQESLFKLLVWLDELGEDGRSKVPLLEKRYDTILGGGYLLYLLMKKLNIKNLSVSDRDGMEGYALHIFQTKYK